MLVFDLLLSSAFRPFSIAFGLVAALTCLELVLLMTGLSAFGGETDLDADLDVVADVDADIDSALTGEAAVPHTPDGGAVAGGLGGWLGLGAVPFAIWAACALTAFGACGWILQLVLSSVLGAPAPGWAAALLVVAPALMIGGRLARFIGRAVPKIETEAVSRARLGGRIGVMGVGEARRGAPAQARVRDHFGNHHHIRVEPFDDDDRLRQGEEVAIIRWADGGYRAMRLDDARRRADARAE